MLKADTILISPIREVLNDLTDTTVDYILCSSEMAFETSGSKNVLFLHFFDTEEENGYMSFQNKDAESIASFLSRPDANSDLFVCCDSGESRSPAIAAAVLLAVGKTDRDVWENTNYHPNKLVFRKMCRALGVDLSEEAIQKRKDNSDAIYHEAIENGKGQSHLYGF